MKFENFDKLLILEQKIIAKSISEHSKRHKRKKRKKQRINTERNGNVEEEPLDEFDTPPDLPARPPFAKISESSGSERPFQNGYSNAV